VAVLERFIPGGQTVFRVVAKVLLVSAECILVGLAIGTAAHFLGAAPSGYGLGREALQLAWLEGGIPGGALGLLVGLPTFYAILHGRASWKEWAILVGVTFITATVTFMFLSVMTLVFTPLATITVAVAMRSN
jgi:hypothetical protein